ncbi:hypothetical protein EG68_11141 [Paragonimus skrjabini miyazakii]|uniref:SRR1-like domain-containing protein n=1 Tax=Paragonimus skrjabini miyazakii TaxID=59628 RepID=A0A8S9YII7_9TREM|nr:hypothetical protein EG68_11141 [Paragonimus skrjabini miyazakii]
MQTLQEDSPWLRAYPRRRHRKSTTLRYPTLRAEDCGLATRGVVSLEEVEDDFTTICSKFTTFRSYFVHSGTGQTFVNSLLADLRRAFPASTLSEPECVDVLCLGLGNPATNRASLRQLALLDLLIERDTRLARSRTRLYDPVFRCTSRQFIRGLGMQVISKNQEACYPLSPDRYHFIMLPHCAPGLLNNLLLTNWSKRLLDRMVLFSNGWREMRVEFNATGESEDVIAQVFSCINILESILVVGDGNQVWKKRRTSKCLEEHDFEGMRIQWFRSEGLAEMPQQIWDQPPLTFAAEVSQTVDSLTHSKTVRIPDSVDHSRFSADLIDFQTVPCFIDSEDESP